MVWALVLLVVTYFSIRILIASWDIGAQLLQDIKARIAPFKASRINAKARKALALEHVHQQEIQRLTELRRTAKELNLPWSE